MLVLGLDTSESPGRVALLDGAVLAVERVLPEALRHAEWLLPTIDAMLEDSGRTRDELARICVNLGPGSFTGLRIGLATAKGMAQARGIELAGVDGTFAYRERASAERRVCVAIASRRDLAYVRWFSEARPRTETVLMHEAELVERLRNEARPMCVIGTAARRLVERMEGGSQAFLGPQEALEPSALAVARLGAVLREARLHILEPMYVEPVLAKT
jgi:tRNA threonylcarbamoyladenosine biosynthesis protein TsaB